MSAYHIDQLARLLTVTSSRRGLNRLLGGLALGGAVALRDMPKTAAKRKQRKRRKRAALGATPAPPPPAPPRCGEGGPCLVFLSSVTYTGKLGGLRGADAKCQALAEAAGLPGTYKAWLADSTSSPISRFVRSTGPYQLVNGTTVAANWTDLTDGTIVNPINVTETGGGPGSQLNAWTHTRSNGMPGGQFYEHCQNWSSNAQVFADAGFASSVIRDARWTDGSGGRCDQPEHLYCFQQR